MVFQPPPAGITDPPFEVIAINEQWLSFIIGLLDKAATREFWDSSADAGQDGFEEAIAIMSNGVKTVLSNDYIIMQQSGDQTLDDDVWTDVSWDIVDARGAFAALEGPVSVFTLPLPGLYLAHYNLRINHVSGTGQQMRLMMSPSAVVKQKVRKQALNFATIEDEAMFVNVDGEDVFVQARLTGGTTRTLLATSLALASFRIIRLTED